MMSSSSDQVSSKITPLISIKPVNNYGAKYVVKESSCLILINDPFQLIKEMIDESKLDPRSVLARMA